MTAELHQHFRALAAYNQAANRDLYAAVATLPEAEYFGMRPAFFGTLHATLNHLLLIDGVWFGRVAGTPSVATDHTEILCPDLDSLTEARVAVIHVAAGEVVPSEAVAPEEVSGQTERQGVLDDRTSEDQARLAKAVVAEGRVGQDLR